MTPGLWSLVLFIFLSTAMGCTDPETRAPIRSARRGTSGPDPGVHRLLLLDGPLSEAHRARIEAQAVRLLTRVGEQILLAEGSEAAFLALATSGLVRGVIRPGPRDRIGPRLAQVLEGGDNGQPLCVQALLSPARGDPEADLGVLRPFAASVHRDGFIPLYTMCLSRGVAEALAEQDALRWLELVPGPPIPLLDESRKAIGVESVQAAVLTASPPTYSLGGKGLVGGIWDPHGVEATHGDLAAHLLRAPDPKNASSLSHGTAVAGCMAGTGALSAAAPAHPFTPYQLRGMAPEAGLVMYLATGDADAAGQATTFADQYLEARKTFKMEAVNLSFSLGTQAVYTSSCANLDFVIAGRSSDLPAPVPFCVSSGNEGWKYGYGSVTELGSAKNVLTLGASDAADGTLVSFSSMGPTADGRLKPELLAPGCASHGKTRVGLDRLRLIGPAGQTVKDFTFASGLDGFSIVRDLTGLAAQNGVLTAVTSGDDPGLYSPSGLGLKATDISTVEVTLSADRHHRAELFWKTDKGDFHGSRSKTFLIRADGALHTYSIALTGHAEWKDVIQQLRLDPITTGIALTSTGNTYSTACGTSMSSPIAAGAILLLVQAWRQVFPATERPTPALVKALLVATAQDLIGAGPGVNPDLGTVTPYTDGPDFATGYGELRLDRAVGLVEAARAGPVGFVEGRLHQAGRQSRVRVRLGGTLPPRLTVTLAWDDPPGEPGGTLALQNDLDLSVSGPDGKLLRPWLLDATQPEKAASQGIDRKNNLEQVPINNPTAGDYLVVVDGYQLVQPPQPFALALSEVKAVTRVSPDLDGDSYYSDESDCDDTNPLVHPGRSEIPQNGLDDDCSSATPDSLPSTDMATPIVADSLALDGPQAPETGSFPRYRANGGGCQVHAKTDRTPLGWVPILLLLLLGVRSIRSVPPGRL